MNRTTDKLLAILFWVSALLCLAPSGTAGVLESAAAATLEEPYPYVYDNFFVTWDRVQKAGSYEVKLVLNGRSSGKSVTRTYTTTKNKLDLTLFAAGCDVEVSVRAVPSAANKKNYKTSDWGVCEDTIQPTDDNAVNGFAGVSGSKFYLADENGKKLSGWQKVNRFWYYFDPAAGSLSTAGWAVIDGASYYFEESGKMHTGWLAWEGRWYFMDAGSGRMVTGWHQVSPNNMFYFTENADANNPRGSLNEAVTHASYPSNNPPYALTQGSGSGGPSSGGSSQSSVPATEWKTNPDGSWSYMKNGSLVKNAWENIDGFWYYFNAKGIMQTGWQYINSRWYYLEPNKNGSNGYKYGAMWKNATTPDGYTVNGDGMWVRDGQVVTDRGGAASAGGSSSSGTGSTVGNLITSCRITVTAKDAGAGKCRTASVTGATGCTVTEQTFSKAYESWTPGESITITATLTANSGYKFGTGTSFSCSGAKFSSQSGTETTRTVKLSYTPVMKLEAPVSLYITENNTLKWVAVKQAKRYKIVITGGYSEKSVTKTVSGTQLDLTQYGDIDSSTMALTISALGPEGNSSYIESEKITIDDLGEYKRSNSFSGTLTASDGKLRYTDDSGAPVTGWQQLMGGWYHFRNSGYADGPGWYQDESGHWYYFGSDFRMKTGTITDGGKTYFLNDGSYPNLPLGAWVQ